jgi:hypothetical protein
MTNTLRGDFGELTIEVEQVDVTSALPRADQQWRYMDRTGHEHHWDNGYPTLATVVDETYWCDDCDDEHQISHLECPQCHETITPATVPAPPWREYIPGRRSYFLNGEEITQEQAQELINRTRP